MTTAPANIRFGQVPVSLRETPQWVAWRYITRDGKQTKAPVSPHDGSLADSTSIKTWGTFEQAIRACRDDSTLAGIGFVFSADDPYCGVDLDNSIDADGNVKPWATDLLVKLNSYAEVSPSRRGLKVFIRASKPSKRCRKAYHDGGIEIYDRDRFFPVTGEQLKDYPSDINQRQEELNLVYATVFGGDEPGSAAIGANAGPSPLGGASASATLSDNEIIELARKKPRTAISSAHFGTVNGTTITTRPAKLTHRSCLHWRTTPKMHSRLIASSVNRNLCVPKGTRCMAVTPMVQ